MPAFAAAPPRGWAASGREARQPCGRWGSPCATRTDPSGTRPPRPVASLVRRPPRRGVGGGAPAPRHNLGVALLQPVRVVFEGSVGYYCAGLMDGATVEVRGSAGWGTAESMLNGTVVIDGNAGSGVAASIRGGTVVVRGDAAARAGVSMKGGMLLIGGNCGYMAGFMMQKGTIVICGNSGHALADSMYEGVVFVVGAIDSLGNDAIRDVPTPAHQTYRQK